MVVLLLGVGFGLYANGMNLNGNGSKAVGMGGAFIGLADDYSAVFWNPAGLTQMTKPSVSVFLSDVIPSGSYTNETAGIHAKTQTSHYLAPSAGFFTPLSPSIVVGLYAYVPSGCGAKWNGDDLAVLASGQSFQWESKVGIITVSPVIAFKVSELLSLGASINIDYGLIKLKKPTMLGQYEENLNGWALGGTIGLLLKPSEKYSIGLTYRSPISASISGTATMPGAALLHLPTTSDAKRKAKFPTWLGGGIAFKPSAMLTFTADVQYTHWKALQAFPIEYDDAYWQNLFAQGGELRLQWKNTVQLRFGMEYRFSDSFALRGGYYYDPNPSPNATESILLPQITYNFFTMGVGYRCRRFTVDASVEFGLGKNRTIEAPEVISGVGMPGTHHMNILVPNIGITYLF